MSKEKENRQSIKSLKSLAVYLKEVETKAWEVLAHIAQADREFFFLLCPKRKNRWTINEAEKPSIKN